MRMAQFGFALFGAALLAAGSSAGVALAQQDPAAQPGGPSPGMEYCLRTADGKLDCRFATLTACEDAAKGKQDACVRSPATVGSGAPTGAPMADPEATRKVEDKPHAPPQPPR